MGNANLTVSLWLRREGAAWFGVAERGGRLVATSVDQSRAEAARILSRSLPPGCEGVAAEGYSAYADAMARTLAAIEAGDESAKSFEIDRELIPEPAASVFRLVASIPPGYAASYGRVAAAAGTIAREVGRLMAGNPLYPLVPCHRVVGSDYSLVGYRGATSGADLDDKLARLLAEARGFESELALGDGFAAFPVERVIAKAKGDRGGEGQLSLW